MYTPLTCKQILFFTETRTPARNQPHTSETGASVAFSICCMRVALVSNKRAVPLQRTVGSSSKRTHRRGWALTRASMANGEETVRSGTCFCEHARVTVTGAPVAVSICHCSICRKLSGAPFSMQALCKAEQVRVEHDGEPETMASSANVERCRCIKCGSPIYASLMKVRKLNARIHSRSRSLGSERRKTD